MVAGITTRDRSFGDLFQSILDRLAKLERPKVIHIGPIGGAVGTIPGYTLSVNASGQLIATSDNGTVTVLALP